MIAAIILAASQSIAMIVIGRVFQGVAVSLLCHISATWWKETVSVWVYAHVYIGQVSTSTTLVSFLLQISFASVSVPVYKQVRSRTPGEWCKLLPVRLPALCLSQQSCAICCVLAALAHYSLCCSSYCYSTQIHAVSDIDADIDIDTYQ